MFAITDNSTKAHIIQTQKEVKENIDANTFKVTHFLC